MRTNSVRIWLRRLVSEHIFLQKLFWQTNLLPKWAIAQLVQIYKAFADNRISNWQQKNILFYFWGNFLRQNPQEQKVNLNFKCGDNWENKESSVIGVKDNQNYPTQIKMTVSYPSWLDYAIIINSALVVLGILIVAGIIFEVG